MFIFGVLTYNQNNTILYTLESIKYQVEHFGNGIKVGLYVVDDFSKDNTGKLVKKWLELNCGLFDYSEIIYNDQNYGTVYGHNLLMEKIRDCKFKIIAGDDLFPANNVIQDVISMKEDDLIVGMPLYLNDNKLFFSEKRLVDYLYYKHKKKNKRYFTNEMIKGGLVNTPSCLYTAENYYKSNCTELLGKFRLFEDDPKWYSMLKNNDNLNITFNNMIYVLYRISSSSVSQNRNTENPFYKELLKLHKIYCNDGVNAFLKIYLKSKDSKLPKFLRVDRYADKYRDLIHKIWVKFFYKKEYDFEKIKLRTEEVKQQKYYKDIIFRVGSYEIIAGKDD